MTAKIQCWACGEGHLTRRHTGKSVTHEGIVGTIDQTSHVCDECGAVLFSEVDVRENKRSWNRFRKSATMAPLGCEIERMRVGAGLTQRRAAELFGGGPVAFSKYENDDLVPDEAMNKLLRLAIAHPDIVRRLEELSGSRVLVRHFSFEAEDDAYSGRKSSAITATRKGVRSTTGVTSTRSFEVRQSQEPSWILQ